MTVNVDTSKAQKDFENLGRASALSETSRA
jgi:hypothetical protein